MTTYITTPIYYVNDVPHLGHAYTTIIADALARFHRMAARSPADQTWFLTGTDEHGQKIEEAANKRGVSPQALTDEVAPRFAATWQALTIANDDFIRTTEPRHKAVVRELWRRLDAAGDLYLAAYEGWYCVGCEAFYTESQLTKVGDAWHCATHQRAVEWVAKERSWFFRLSKYAAPLIAHIEANPTFIRPEGYRNEVLAFLKSGLKDLSVSRTSFAWGIVPPVADPDGKPHVMYVWLDALTNYLSALCDVDGDHVNFQSSKAKTFWPHAVHLIGKDILRFHAVYWPAFLLSAGLPLPTSIVCHGWWTVRGEKISKSLPATRIDPVALANALATTGNYGAGLGVDAMRYYLLREVPLGNDGDFTMASLFSRYNAELANDLGNLINRTLTLLGKFATDWQPQHGTAHGDSLRGLQHDIEAALVSTINEAQASWREFAPARALEATWRLVREGNRYVDGSAPWALAKAAVGDTNAASDLRLALHTMRGMLIVIADLISPVLPTAGDLLRNWLGLDRSASWPSGLAALQEVPPRPLATNNKPMFPRFDAPTMAQIEQVVLPMEANVPVTTATTNTASASATPQATAAANAGATATASTTAQISYDDFMKMELRVGKVVRASAVPKAKKLLHLSVDLGEAEPRSIVAGLAEAFAPEALVGKYVLVVANLAPATIRGVPSNGMVLAIGDDAILGLASVDRDVPVGSRIR